MLLSLFKTAIALGFLSPSLVADCIENFLIPEFNMDFFQDKRKTVYTTKIQI
jgi:hypothetical protein